MIINDWYIVASPNDRPIYEQDQPEEFSSISAKFKKATWRREFRRTVLVCEYNNKDYYLSFRLNDLKDVLTDDFKKTNAFEKMKNIKNFFSTIIVFLQKLMKEGYDENNNVIDCYLISRETLAGFKKERGLDEASKIDLIAAYVQSGMLI